MKISYLLLVLLLVGCNEDQVARARKKREEAYAKEVEQIRQGLRFAAKLYTLGDADAPLNNAVWIIEIEGHRYAQYGSLIHLESCPCKTNKPAK